MCRQLYPDVNVPFGVDALLFWLDYVGASMKPCKFELCVRYTGRKPYRADGSLWDQSPLLKQHFYTQNDFKEMCRQLFPNVNVPFGVYPDVNSPFGNDATLLFWLDYVGAEMRRCKFNFQGQ